MAYAYRFVWEQITVSAGDLLPGDRLADNIKFEVSEVADHTDGVAIRWTPETNPKFGPMLYPRSAEVEVVRQRIHVS